MATKKPELKSAAIVTIHRAANMTPRGRRLVANWLRNTAKLLEDHGKEFSTRFTGRYLYKERT